MRPGDSCRRRPGKERTTAARRNWPYGDVFDLEFFAILTFEGDGLRDGRHAGSGFEDELLRRHRDPRPSAFATELQFVPGFSFDFTFDFLPPLPEPGMKGVEDELYRAAAPRFENGTGGRRGRPERVRSFGPISQPRRPPIFDLQLGLPRVGEGEFMGFGGARPVRHWAKGVGRRIPFQACRRSRRSPTPMVTH